MEVKITERDAANVARLVAMPEWSSVGRVLGELTVETANQFSDPVNAADHGRLAWKAGVLGAVVLIEDRINQLCEEHVERVKAAAKGGKDEAAD